jgi:hypothetical protein
VNIIPEHDTIERKQPGKENIPENTMKIEEEE